MVNFVRSKFHVGTDRKILIYPSYGHLDRHELTWKIPIRGAVYDDPGENLQDCFFVRMLRRALKARQGELESEIFRQRVNGFLVQQERGVQVLIRLGSKTYRLRKKTRRNGQFGGILRLPVREVRRLQERGHLHNGWLRYEVFIRHEDESRFLGCSQLIGPRGISVISDIDDTIKHSGVGSRRELLANTFLREFDSIPGMAGLYRQWAYQGAAFHYVSSSPWQLYLPLAELCQTHDFPLGTYHLRTLRLKDLRVLGLLIPGPWGKRKAIRSILRAFPQRRFILVGDSGQKDPELYGGVARKHDGQVSRIFIRSLDGRWLHPDRVRRAFRGVRRDVWRVFRDSDEVSRNLRGIDQL